MIHQLVQFIHRNLAYLIIIFLYIKFYKIYKEKMNDLYYHIKFFRNFYFQLFRNFYSYNGVKIYIASMHQISSIFLLVLVFISFFINKH